MAQTNYVSTGLVGVNFYQIDDTAQHKIGTRCRAVSADYGQAEMIYLAGGASVAEGTVVTFDEAGVITLLAANAVGPVAVSLTANTSTSDYSWYQVLGKACVVSSAAADNALLGRESADGTLGDAEAVGDQINGLISRSATDTPATGYQWVQIFSYPYVNDFTPTAA